MASYALSGATLVAMAIQGAGGGIAAFAKEIPVAQMTSHVMLAAVSLQLCIMMTYLWLFLELVWRYTRNQEAKPFRLRRTSPDMFVPRGKLSEHDEAKLKILLLSNGVGSSLVFVRIFYRFVSLVTGPSGELLRCRPIATGILCMLIQSSKFCRSVRRKGDVHKHI